jgi:hypothetical protein
METLFRTEPFTSSTLEESALQVMVNNYRLLVADTPFKRLYYSHRLQAYELFDEDKGLIGCYQWTHDAVKAYNEL